MDPRHGRPKCSQDPQCLVAGDLARGMKGQQEVLLALFAAPPGDEDALFRAIANLAEVLTGSRAAFLVAVEDESRVVRSAFSDRAARACAVPKERLDGTIPHGALWAECLRERRPVFHNAISSLKLQTSGHIPLSRVLCVPVLDRGRVVAVCGVANKPGPYTRADAERLMPLLEAAWNLVMRGRLELALQEREGMFRALAEQSLAGVGLIGPDGVVFANRALENLSGYTFQEIRDLGPQGFAQCIHPEDRDLVMARHRARMAGEAGLPDTYDFRLLRPDGSARWVTLSVTRVDVRGQPHVAITVVDSHDRHEAEQVREEAFAQVRRTLDATVLTLSRTLEVRDPYTAGHQRRVADLARAIAQEMGLGLDRVEAIRMAGLLHDIGKIGVPAEILARPGSLSPTEMALVQTHCQVGYDILLPVEFPWPIHFYVLEHHERLDGSGYPANKKGDQILLESRVLAVADVVEAMASHRPYRPALGIEKALSTIEEEQGKTLDPDVVRACLRLFRDKGYRLP